MSTPRPLLPALAVLTLAACAHAPGPVAAAAPGAAAPPGRVLVTGSHIPQRVDARSGLPETSFPVRVYSREQLDATGRARDLRAALGALDPSVGP